MAVFGRVLDVCGCDCDTTLSLFWSFIDGTVIEETGKSLLCLSFRDSGCEGSLGHASVLRLPYINGFKDEAYLPFHDRRDQLYLFPISILLSFNAADLRTNINVRLRPLESSSICSRRVQNLHTLSPL